VVQVGTAVVWIIALGLALHIFETTMEIGATQVNWGKKMALGMGILYAGVQLIMMTLGVLLTYILEKLLAIHIISRVYHYMAVLFLIVIAVRRCMNAADRTGFLERRGEPLSMSRCIGKSLQTGLEAVIIGICLYYMSGTALWGGICVLVLSIPGAVGGFLYGYWWGVKQKKMVCMTDAALMALVALVLLI
jgi:putative Mn2+ efflux pump MntP